MTQQLLKIRGLKIEGKSDEVWNPIVNGIDLDLKKGEVLGLIGESGAGKSTVGLAAMGFTRDGCRISGGTVDFDGVDLVTASAAVKRNMLGKRIAYVAQSAAASFNPAHRLIDQHTEAPTQHRLRPKAESELDGMELYRRLRLPDPDHIGFRYPHQVSGGQLQRAMTAMAMSCRPDLIIFDEPTTALDVTIQAQILALMAQLQQNTGTAIVLITHDLGVVAEVADEVVVMYAGKVVERAPVQALFDTPQHPYTVGLLGSIPQLDEVQERLASIEGQVPNPLNRPAGCAFAQRCPFAQDNCKVQTPTLTEILPGHWSACLRAPLHAETLMSHAKH